jgi:hypothetical protein
MADHRRREHDVFKHFYTGEITKVRSEYIDYDVNAFTRRYGESIILLDEDPPEGSVTPCDHGCAVACCVR